ncbi:MAG: hypothetical protein U0984_18890, partial [Prosthecobacter sp.]|nr:hypothetical protein [Prosthecobacter sp.]
EKAIAGILSSIGAAHSGPARAAKTDFDVEKAAFVFDEKSFFLREDRDGLREFLPEGETFEKWTTLMADRQIEGSDDAKAYAAKILENAKASGPNNKGRLIANEAADIYIADFLMFPTKDSDPSYAEWNLMRVTKTDTGVKYVQYARRFYNFDESTSKVLIAEREKILPLLAGFEIPSNLAAPAKAAMAGKAPAVQTYSYPNKSDAAFTVDFPADWKLEPTDEGVHVVSGDKLVGMNLLFIDMAEVNVAVEAMKKKVGADYKSIKWNYGGDPQVMKDDATGVTATYNMGEAMDGDVKYCVNFTQFAKKGGEKFLLLLTQAPEEAVFKTHAEDIMKVSLSVKIK